MTEISEIIDDWADDEQGPVALCLKQNLQPVEPEGDIIFPPTYADIGYNIDTLSDGTKVALVDSVGSQANRMEPIFKRVPFSELVPNIQIELPNRNNGEDTERVSLLDLGHRCADATVQASPKLLEIVSPALELLRRQGNAVPLCAVAPTSLVFGFWDSRGRSNEKRPRLIRSIVRAWDVEVLHSAAQFNSIWKMLDEKDQKELKDEEAKSNRVKRSVAGLADAPSTFRDTKLGTVLNNRFNPDARVLGGIRVNGSIVREVTINLNALRMLGGGDDDETNKVKRYLLALAIIVATADIDLYFREGCHLRYMEEHDQWLTIPRRGEPSTCSINWISEESQKELLEYAKDAVRPFKEHWPKVSEGKKAAIYKFDLKEAKKLLLEKGDDENDD